MASKLNKTLRYLLSVALAGGLFWYACSKVDWDSFAENLSNCRWGFILLAMLIGASSAIFRGLRWRILLLPLADRVRRTTTIGGFCMAYLSNMAIPYSGEILRCGFVSSKIGVPFEKILGTLALERVWDLVTMFLLLLLALALGAGQFGEFLSSWISGSLYRQVPRKAEGVRFSSSRSSSFRMKLERSTYCSSIKPRIP